MPNTTAPNPEAIAAYRLDISYRFGVTLRRFKNGDFEEICSEVITDSPTFVNVVQAVRQQHPGWSIYESWEIPQPTPQAPEKSLEALFQEFEDTYQQAA